MLDVWSKQCFVFFLACTVTTLGEKIMLMIRDKHEIVMGEIIAVWNIALFKLLTLKIVIARFG